MPIWVDLRSERQNALAFKEHIHCHNRIRRNDGLHGMEVQHHREAKDAMLEWLLWCNGSRMHSTLRYLSPAKFGAINRFALGCCL